MINKVIDNHQWLFIDESGKPEVYSARGENLIVKNKASKYLVLAAIRSESQLELQQQVVEFRLSLLKNKDLTNIFSSSYSLDAFHAQTDYPEIKEQFYAQAFAEIIILWLSIILVMVLFWKISKARRRLYCFCLIFYG